MSEFTLYGLTGVGLVSAGLWGFLFRTHLIRKLIALNIMGGGVFLIMVATAYRNRDSEPDPVPHAMVVTGIVVSVSATVLGIALARRIQDVTGRPDLPEDVGDT